MKLEFNYRHCESSAWEKNMLVCGIDEVGRGCLAGPVVVAAVILPLQCKKNFIDSKKISEKQRIFDFGWIIKHCRIAIAHAHHKTIDQKNIYKTTQALMLRAYSMIYEKFTSDRQFIKYLISDAMPLSPHPSVITKNLEISHFNYGESISPTIAAASIVAKVTRDRIMQNMTHLFPAFSFNKHKGYGTKEHALQIQNYGLTLIHRRSFITQARKENHGEQQHLLF